jgi:ketosteroid isomerase-like protein
MSARTIKALLLVCFLILAWICMWGCDGPYKSVDWPAITQDEGLSTPAMSSPNATVEKNNMPAGENMVKLTKEGSNPASEADVRQAAETFYSAMNSMFAGDAGPMNDVWSHAPDVTNVGISGSAQNMQVGWSAVSAAFERQAQAKSGTKVAASGLVVDIKGNLAYTECFEQWEQKSDEQGKTGAEEHHASSVFRYEDGRWKVVHHHTDAAQVLKEVPSEQENEDSTIKINPLEKAEPKDVP